MESSYLDSGPSFTDMCVGGGGAVVKTYQIVHFKYVLSILSIKHQ